MTTYGTAVGVKTRTGVRPDDLGLDDDTALDTYLAELLAEATDLMDRRMRRSWGDELDAGTISEIPAGLHGIANDIVATSVRETVASRQTPVVRIDDFAVRTVTSRLFTPDILERLRLYGRSAAGSLDVGTDLADAGTDALYAHELDSLQSGEGEGLV